MKSPQRAEATREKAEPLYDSSERRERDADKLEQRGIGRESVSAKMAADFSQGKPATEAVKAQQSADRESAAEPVAIRRGCSARDWGDEVRGG